MPYDIVVRKVRIYRLIVDSIIVKAIVISPSSRVDLSDTPGGEKSNFVGTPWVQRRYIVGTL